MRVDLNRSRGKRAPAVIAAALFILIGSSFTARMVLPQQQRQSGQAIPGQTPNTPFPPDAESGTMDEQKNPMLAQMRRRQEAQRNAERQKAMVNDANKLLALAAELKQDAAKSNQDSPPPEISKEADQIEKLAKSVRDKMRAF